MSHTAFHPLASSRPDTPHQHVPVRATIAASFLALLGAITPALAVDPTPAAVIVDTDIGADIDDAFALALVLNSPELELRGVTTVAGDAHTRARLVCRLLNAIGRDDIPVAAGQPPRSKPELAGMHQYGLRAAQKNPVRQSAVEFLRDQVAAGPGELTIVALGPLTNVAELLTRYPESKGQIRRIVLMGGSVRIGYNGRQPAEPEWNIKTDIAAAQTVFASGVPLSVVPLDASASLKLDAARRRQVFSAETTLCRHLHALYELWDKETPVLFDPAAAAMAAGGDFFEIQELRLEVDGEGMTRIVDGKPNARVAMKVRTEELLDWVVERIVQPALSANHLPEELMIEIDPSGRPTVFGNRLSSAQLQDLIQDAAGDASSVRRVTIHANPQTSFGAIQQLVGACRRAGLTDFKLATQEPRPNGNPSQLVERGRLPARVHVAEDYETDIERRWWLAGKLETTNVPPRSTRACRAVLCRDFDGRMGQRFAIYRAVIFNPVPGPPMGPNTRLAFRYHLSGSDTLRVQIYSLSNGYHRHLTLSGLTQGRWESATVDMTDARRPDGSGGPLSEDERIDDIQFYVDPAAELLIDNIVLYDAASADEQRPFPARVLFTGWFDTGKQGIEWPGQFEIVPHEPPRKWKAASAIAAEDGGHRILLDLRGPRPLGEQTRLRLRYLSRLPAGSGGLAVGSEPPAQGVRLRFYSQGKPVEGACSWEPAASGRWAEADLDLTEALKPLHRSADANSKPAIDQIEFTVLARWAPPGRSPLLIDDVLLYQPGEPPGP
jgi:inosine-uridine nucleoside N-ribohydrolase